MRVDNREPLLTKEDSASAKVEILTKLAKKHVDPGAIEVL